MSITIKGPIRLGHVKDKADYTQEFVDKLKTENVSIKLPFSGENWQSTQNADLLGGTPLVSLPEEEKFPEEKPTVEIPKISTPKAIIKKKKGGKK